MVEVQVVMAEVQVLVVEVLVLEAGVLAVTEVAELLGMLVVVENPWRWWGW